MKPGRLWHLVGSLRRRWVHASAGEPVGRQQPAGEISEVELREFLEGDIEGDSASPEFRERLRRDLWSRLERSSARHRGQRPD